MTASQLLARPPRIIAGLAMLWLVAVVYQASDAGLGITEFFIIFFGGAAIAVTAIARFALFIGVRRSGAERRISRLHLVAPVTILLGLGSQLLGPPDGLLFRMRFAASAGALTEAARTALAAPPAELVAPRRIGLFRVQHLAVHKGQVRFITNSCGVVDACGLVYVANGAPERWQEDRFSHIAGPWWHLFQGF